MVRELELVVNGYFKVFFRKLADLTCECCHWHCPCGKCSAGFTVRCAEHGIYLDENLFASSLTIPGALPGLPAENVVSFCHI